MQGERQLSRGEATRERLLSIAEQSVIAKGFSNTSIEEIICEAGLTKSGFFYHFPDKTALAKGLIERFKREDSAVMAAMWARAEELSDDPLQVVLIALKLMAEAFAELETVHPGCIVASVAYHDRQFDEEVRALNASAVQVWRDLLRARLAAAAERHPPVIAVDLAHLADMLPALVDGAMINERVLDERGFLVEQLLLYRSFVQAVFTGR